MLDISGPWSAPTIRALDESDGTEPAGNAPPLP